MTTGLQALPQLQLQAACLQHDPPLQQQQRDGQTQPPPAVPPQCSRQELQQQDLGDMIDRLDRMLQCEQRSIRVHVGIDEDLRMILDMDPSIVDMVPPVEPPASVTLTSPRLGRLPPRGPPSFKHSSLPLRTQMKQQLMREQQLQQERREQQQRLQLQQEAAAAAEAAGPPRVPVNIGVDVPQSVQTVLENPTKYHVLERSRSQVRQYVQASLQQNQQQLAADANLAPGVVLPGVAAAGGYSGAAVPQAPGLQPAGGGSASAPAVPVGPPRQPPALSDGGQGSSRTLPTALTATSGGGGVPPPLPPSTGSGLSRYAGSLLLGGGRAVVDAVPLAGGLPPSSSASSQPGTNVSSTVSSSVCSAATSASEASGCGVEWRANRVHTPFMRYPAGQTKQARHAA
ncbi:hypothetical protein ONE63_008939 [Megalurothrips usitatus]|uniref:MiT/TFE transcription factors N-terminal domain-containing protein n=1 Tax=Megalurothrips usitatus TaxID=439358 RepID=A0AAV7XJ00_9NEOP|nr:hypothetical protein ONE63_008939 [Megalurothrips usitatus]